MNYQPWTRAGQGYRSTYSRRLPTPSITSAHTSPATQAARQRHVLLAAGDYRCACDLLFRWGYARVAGVSVRLPGLTKRREMERQVCLGERIE